MRLPNVAGWEGFAEALWQAAPDGHNVTPYVDAIELLDFTMSEKEETDEGKEAAADAD